MYVKLSFQHRRTIGTMGRQIFIFVCSLLVGLILGSLDPSIVQEFELKSRLRTPNALMDLSLELCGTRYILEENVVSTAMTLNDHFACFQAL